LSDLLNPYVGISEKNIKNAFSLAEKEEAVLIMDEIESLLYSRDRAVHSWELSLTNEFLTQMERFRGLLICTTNRIKDLDEASLRRFTFKLKFDFLLPEGNVAFYERLIQPLLPEPMNPKIRNQLQQIPCLTPGDFKTVRDRFFFYPKNQLDHQKMIRSLKQEVEIKKRRQQTGRIGFLSSYPVHAGRPLKGSYAKGSPYDCQVRS
ncbi:MAG: AAA family ATPase, partial [Deltaproteobacteria bacterium]|nr:AAA family ATPase [Deltaproteobacteria bacterium]